MELPEEAAAPALAAWNLVPSNQWFLAEYLRSLRAMELYPQVLECSLFVRGGGVCRYYLADSEERLGLEVRPSMEYLLCASGCSDDSTAADANLWLSLIYLHREDTGAALSAASSAVRLMPEEEFYRCVLAERMAEAGSIETSRELLHGLRLDGVADRSYWQAMEALAEAESDQDRRIWALRRARECRLCPGTDRELGWALYLAGRNALRDGDTNGSRELLTEASGLGDTSEVFALRADSLLELLDEFENRGPGSR